MDGITILGLIAAVLVNIAFIPQTIKSWKTKKTGDLSLIMYFIYITGIGLWLVYGSKAAVSLQFTPHFTLFNFPFPNEHTMVCSFFVSKQ